MNAALVQWLMAPDAAGVDLELADFLGRPEWAPEGGLRAPLRDDIGVV